VNACRAGGRLRWRAPLALALLCASCAAPGEPPSLAAAPADATMPPAPPAVERPAMGSIRIPDEPVAADEGDLPPSILLPKPQATDDEVARVAGLSIHKRHVFDRMLETSPQQARDLVDNLILDVLVAARAERYGLRVDSRRIAARLEQDEQQLRKQVAAEWSGQLSLDEYVLRQFDMDLAEYRRWNQLNLARKFYREYVIRYEALLQDRVQVRYMVSSDRATLEGVAKQVREGASFAGLALRHSEDETRKDGGLLPPFGAGMKHPIAATAMELEPGKLSEIIAAEQDGQTRYYLVYCLKRIPGRRVAFADVRAEIDADIEARPLTRFDFNAFYLATRGEAETLNLVHQRR
jgi:parvulin-like peptidyl-prolyl isomerase